ncbi:hypothetical protein [Streptomyces sp. NPDC056479]|uniref:hypothetical protein n=1 Tax=unclassified Streptomyces TaxID=2593676 RepID=UPI0036C8C3F2
MAAIDVALPLLSVLIGSAITYLLNVRTRRRSKVEDLFHAAIEAVAVTVARHHFYNRLHAWDGSTPEDHAELNRQMGREGMESYARAVAEARAALARASVYAPELKEYFGNNMDVVYFRADEIIEKLRRRL